MVGVSFIGYLLYVFSEDDRCSLCGMSRGIGNGTYSCLVISKVGNRGNMWVLGKMLVGKCGSCSEGPHLGVIDSCSATERDVRGVNLVPVREGDETGAGALVAMNALAGAVRVDGDRARVGLERRDATSCHTQICRPLLVGRAAWARDLRAETVTPGVLALPRSGVVGEEPLRVRAYAVGEAMDDGGRIGLGLFARGDGNGGVWRMLVPC